jgi:deoxyribonuclease-1
MTTRRPLFAARRLLFAASLCLGMLTAACGPELGTLDAVTENEEDESALPGHVMPESIPAGYYSAATGKSGSDLLVALSDIISRGPRSLSYSAAREKMFADVEDPDNDNAIDCVYTGRIARGVSSTSGGSAAKLNTEHTWPQSLGARGVAQTDIHHLWASDIDSNSRRSNYPFGVVKTVTWTAPNPDGQPPSKLGKDDSGRLVFEPHDRTKGDIARSIFYFYTRYYRSRPTDFSLGNFNVEEATLRRWHESDPPDADEISHNDLVYAIQGNRNPYIDHPEYLKEIPDFPDR